MWSHYSGFFVTTASPAFVFPFIETHISLSFLPLLPTSSLAPPLAARWGWMLRRRAPIGRRSEQEKARLTNGSSPRLVHHSEVMWSGGGLKESLISTHTPSHCRELNAELQFNWLERIALLGHYSTDPFVLFWSV